MLELFLKAYHDGVASIATRGDPVRFGQLLPHVIVANHAVAPLVQILGVEMTLVFDSVPWHYDGGIMGFYFNILAFDPMFGGRGGVVISLVLNKKDYRYSSYRTKLIPDENHHAEWHWGYQDDQEEEDILRCVFATLAKCEHLSEMVSYQECLTRALPSGGILLVPRSVFVL